MRAKKNVVAVFLIISVGINIRILLKKEKRRKLLDKLNLHIRE
jgi:hypothetical protein